MDKILFIGAQDTPYVFSKYYLKTNAGYNNTLMIESEIWSGCDVDSAKIFDCGTTSYNLSKDYGYALEKAITSNKRSIRNLGFKFALSFKDKTINKRQIYKKLMQKLALSMAKRLNARQ